MVSCLEDTRGPPLVEPVEGKRGDEHRWTLDEMMSRENKRRLYHRRYHNIYVYF